MSQHYEVGLLGGFSVRSAGDALSLVTGSRRLLAFLATRGPCERAEVAGRLWPDTSDGHALARLRTGIWRLNVSLPGALTSEIHSVALSAKVGVDSWQQEALARALLEAPGSDTSWLRARVHHLLLGDLLPGWYDDWVVHERERLRQLRLHALERAALIFLREGEFDFALALALEAVRAEPLRESANIILMSVHLAEGNVIDAVRRYEQFKGHLSRELDVDPSPAMAHLLPELARRRRAGVVPT